jgi:3'-phosphoadenosine 5'-phosphosulfate sulfotransferase (PAPS reductase)/FAD synthetase
VRKLNDYIVVAYGGGVNSTAMLIGMRDKGIQPNLILFADTGAEMPHTYEYIDIMNQWLKLNYFPEIITVKNVDKNGNIYTLEDECLSTKILPAIAYGHKNCSLKHKLAPQDKFCNNHEPLKKVWQDERKAIKYVIEGISLQDLCTEKLIYIMFQKSKE